MSNKIATISLSMGRVGYYDELTRTHLTIQNRFASVYDYMDTTNLKRALHDGVILLIDGSLENEPSKSVDFVEIEKKPTPKKKTVKEPVIEEKVQETEEVEKEDKKEIKKEVKKETKKTSKTTTKNE